MAEEAQVQAPAAANQTATTDANTLSPQGQAVAQTLAMAAKDPEFAKIPEVAKLVELAKGKQPAVATPAAEPKESVADFRKEEAAIKKESTPVETAEEATERKSVLFAKKTAKPTVEFKEAADYNKYIKEKFGVEDPAAFMTSAEKWRADSQLLPETSDKAAALEQIFDKLPDSIYDAIQVWGKGGDWMESLRSGVPTIDYNKAFDKQVEKVVSQYFPKTFTSEQLEDITDQVAQNAIKVAKTRFDLEKTNIENKRGEALERAEKLSKSLKESAGASVSKLDESFPDMDSRKKSEIKSMMVSGDFESLFKKKDGTWKPEAAEMLALAIYGKDEIANTAVRVKTKTASETQTKTLMETLNRGAETPHKTAESQAQMPTLPADIQKSLEQVNRKSFY